MSLPGAGIEFYNGTQGAQGGGSSTFSGSHSALTELDYASAGHTGFEPTVTKGNLTATSPLQIDQTRQLIGGAAVISLLAAYTPRERLTANRTYYVRTDGNDSNTGLVDSAAGAFLTLQAAANAAMALDFNGYTVTLKVGAGTYTAGIILTNARPDPGAGGGSPKLVVEGDTSTPANVLLNLTSATCLWADESSVEFKGFKLQTTTSGYGIYATNHAVVEFSAIEFGACAQAHIQAYAGSRVRATGNYSISGSSVFHWLAQLAGIIEVGNRTVTITGTPAFSWAFTLVNNVASVICHAMTFNGSATGARYDIASNGVVNTAGGGATYLPGNAAGTTATGGQYV